MTHEPSPPAFNVPPVTLWLCLGLVACYLLSLGIGVWPGTAGGRLALDVQAFRGQFAPGAGLQVWPLLALPGHVLLHAGFGHFAVNAGMLLAFGSQVERSLGGGALLTLSLAGAVAGGLAMVALAGDQPAYLVGASDAVHAVAGATALVMLRFGTGRGRRTGLVLLGFLVGINLLLALIGEVALIEGLRIGWQAHLGGLAAGLALTPWLIRRRRKRL